MIATSAFSATAQSSQAVDYGLVKFISGGNEYKKDQSYKFEFSGNIIYEYEPNVIRIDLMDGTSSSYQPYGKYVGTRDGNLMYQKYVKGRGIMGSYNNICENEYYLVSSDKSVINRIQCNSVGEPIYIYVFHRKSKPSYRMY